MDLRVVDSRSMSESAPVVAGWLKEWRFERNRVVRFQIPTADLIQIRPREYQGKRLEHFYDAR